GVGELRPHCDEFRQSAIDRRRAVEADVGTQVVSTRPTLTAMTARHARFDGHTFAHSRPRDSLADLNDLTGRFVSQDQRAANHEIGDAAVLVIGTSDPQTPTDRIRTRTSPSDGVGTGRCSIRRSRGAYRTAAVIEPFGRPRLPVDVDVGMADQSIHRTARLASVRTATLVVSGESSS